MAAKLAGDRTDLQDDGGWGRLQIDAMDCKISGTETKMAASLRGVESQARPTLAEIRRWPATVSVEMSAAAFGCSRAHAYESIKTGTYPARTIRVGGRIAVLTSSILKALDEAI